MSNESPNPNLYPLGEPSVLDYVKSLFRFGNGDRIHVPEFVEEEQPEKLSAISTQLLVTDTQVEEVPGTLPKFQPSAFRLPPSVSFPWRSLLAFFLALIGQRLFEPPPTVAPLGYTFYIGALILLGWAIRRREWTLPALAESSENNDPLTYRLIPSIASVILIFWSFLLFTNNLFTVTN